MKRKFVALSGGLVTISRSVFEYPVRGALAAVALAGSCGSAYGQTYCSEPVEPGCVSVRFSVENASSAARCRQAVEDYASALEDYFSCLDKKKAELRQSVDELKAELAEKRD